MAAKPLRIDESRVLWFRARRSHLARGARDPIAAARAILGAQAQQEGPALHALSLRVRNRPTATALKSLLLEDHRLVRTWGQRDTLHVYDPADWATVIAALPALPRSGRRGGMPPADLLEAARRYLRRASEPVLRRDLFPMLPADYLEALRAHPGVGGSVERLAVSRLFWLLAREGELCFADRVGAEVRYAPRHLFFPDLDWTPPTTEEAVRRLARRYLATFGPATPADLAHFLGAKVTSIRERLEELGDELLAVECGDRAGLVALARDRRGLTAAAPSADRWPARLLPQWDTHLMTHKDKTWVLPRREEWPEVWRKAAVVAPVVLAGGRIVATWKHRVARRTVHITAIPLSGWRPAYRHDVSREGAEVARHLGRESAEIEITEAS